MVQAEGLQSPLPLRCGNVVSLRQMPDTSYQLARFKVIGYTIGVVGYLNFAVVL